MSRGAIARADNLFDFFLHSIDEAASRNRSPLCEESLYYLTQLLVERGRNEEPGQEPQTLVELYQEAWRGQGPRQLKGWRELADRALYVTGFFRGSLSRKLVSVDYYMEMGASAYQRLARLVSGPPSAGRGLDEVWAELGRNFEQASDLLLDVHEDLRAAEATTDADVLKLYEAWLETGSPRLLARLQELGVIASGRPPKDDLPS